MNVTSLKWSPLITFDDFRDPPLLMSSFSKRIWVVPPLNPSKVFNYPPFGFSVTIDPPFCFPKNQVIPPKIPPPPSRPGDKLWPVLCTIVSRGDWLGNPANMKVENNGAVVFVGSSLIVHNPLFFVHKLWLNKLMRCLYWSVSSKWWECCWTLCNVRSKKANKNI